jgi:succinate dehydrogenase / fumarate reductase, membrane anchor subunit
MSLGESATGLGRVRGLGAAGEGGEHWILGRLLSLAQLLLGSWLLAALLMLPSLDRGILLEWLRSPWGAVPMALFIVTAFWHAVDGMKVIVDDYVDDEGLRFAVNAFILFAAVGGGTAALFALLRVALGGQG